MAIFQLEDTVLVHLYRCPICHKVWDSVREGPKMSCTVLHGPGGCCHYMEREITPELLQDVVERLEGIAAAKT